MFLDKMLLLSYDILNVILIGKLHTHGQMNKLLRADRDTNIPAGQYLTNLIFSFWKNYIKKNNDTINIKIEITQYFY